MEIFDFNFLVSSGLLRERRTVFSVGVFDGVHRGHHAILSALKRKAGEADAISLAITFSSNPKKNSTGSLDTLRLRSLYIESFGIDFLAVIDFSSEFSKITACGFASLISELCNPVGAVFGSDFRFGSPESQKEGKDFSGLLSRCGRECSVEIVDSVLDAGGVRISSTRLRKMIENGELEDFLRLSGQFYRVDLVPIPYRSCSGELIFSRASIHQLLPPLGTYDTGLLVTNGTIVKCVLEIDREFLSLSAPSLLSAIGSEQCQGKGKLQLDSIFLEKKKDDYKRTEE